MWPVLLVVGRPVGFLEGGRRSGVRFGRNGQRRRTGQWPADGSLGRPEEGRYPNKNKISSKSDGPILAGTEPIRPRIQIPRVALINSAPIPAKSDGIWAVPDDVCGFVMRPAGAAKNCTVHVHKMIQKSN